MTNPAIGLPAVVINNLPGPLNIQSTTVGPPAVITTTTPHNILPGEYFIVAGAADPDLNGIVFMAGTVTSTNIAVLQQPGGTPVTGSLAGGAAGTVQSLGYGTTVPLLSDGDAPTASLWNVIYQALLNYTAYLLYYVRYALVAPVGSIIKLLGRKVLLRPRVVLSDASHTIDVSQGDIFILSESPGAVRSIIIDSTTVVPEEGECVQLLVPKGLATGLKYHVFRDDATPIADLYGNAAGDSPVWSGFEYSGGVWRLGANMGGGASGGVLPQAGA